MNPNEHREKVDVYSFGVLLFDVHVLRPSSLLAS